MRRNAKARNVMAALAALAAGLGPNVTGAYGAPLWSQVEPAATSSESRPGGSAAVVTYAVEGPCDSAPAATDPKIARHRPPHKIRHRPAVHKVVTAKPASVVPKATPIVHRPTVHRPKLYKVAAKARHRRLHLARVAPPLKRCVTLHSERLSTADLAYGGAPAAALALAPPDPDFGLGGGDDGGDGGWGGGGWGGGGGGGGGGGAGGGGGGGWGGGGGSGGGGGGGGPVSGTPEPAAWMLMILGVGLCGSALRRNRRTPAAA